MTNYMDWWLFALKNMAKLDHLPDALRNRIFERLFLKAEIAKLSKKERKEYDQSLKKLSDMNLIVRDRDSKIAALSNDVAALLNDVAALSNDVAALSNDNVALQNQLAAYQRKYGALNGTDAKK